MKLKGLFEKNVLKKCLGDSIVNEITFHSSINQKCYSINAKINDREKKLKLNRHITKTLLIFKCSLIRRLSLRPRAICDLVKNTCVPAMS